MEKICSTCKVKKEVEVNFYKDRANIGGYSGICKACRKILKEKNKEKIKEYHRNYHKEYYQKNAARFRKYYRENRERILQYNNERNLRKRIESKEI
jgi:RecJ-like exonuclease